MYKNKSDTIQINMKSTNFDYKINHAQDQDKKKNTKDKTLSKLNKFVWTEIDNLDITIVNDSFLSQSSCKLDAKNGKIRFSFGLAVKIHNNENRWDNQF